jgi:hypothetical protein
MFIILSLCMFQHKMICYHGVINFTEMYSKVHLMYYVAFDLLVHYYSKVSVC